MPYEPLSALTAAQRSDLAMSTCLRYLSCLHFTHGATHRAQDLFAERYPRSVQQHLLTKAFDDVEIATKAAVAPGTTTDPAWAGALIPKPVVAPLLIHVQQQSLLTRLNLRRVPFAAQAPIQNTSASYAWVGENKLKPVTQLTFASSALAVGKISGIIVVTDELVRLADPVAEPALRDELTAGLVAFQDQQFLDPAVSLIANERPASITSGVTPVTSTGNLHTDVAALLAALYANRPGTARPALVMSPGNAGALAGSGQHPDLRTDGSGTAFGVPVVTSPSAGAHVVALDAAAVLYADGGLDLDVSSQAAIEMDTAPVGTGAAIVTSLWQNNLAGFRVERMLWWIKAPNSVQLLVTS